MREHRIKIERLSEEQINQSKAIAIMNNKGGCGKTTTAMALGMYLVRTGNNVLFWDNDPQCNLTQRLGVDDGKLKANRLNFLFKNAEIKPELSLIGKYPFLQRLAGTTKGVGKVGLMAGSHASETHANALKDDLKIGEPDIGHRSIYRYFKECLDYYRQYYNYIVVDTAPALEGNILNALAVRSVNEIVYPIDGIEAALGVKEILTWMEGETATRIPDRPNGTFVMVKYQLDTKNVGVDEPGKRLRNTVYRGMKDVYGDFVCDNGVKEARVLRFKIPGFGGKTEYSLLCKELMEKITAPDRKNLFDYIAKNGSMNQLDGILANIERKIRKRRPKFKRPKYVDLQQSTLKSEDVSGE